RGKIQPAAPGGNEHRLKRPRRAVVAKDTVIAGAADVEAAVRPEGETLRAIQPAAAAADEVTERSSRGAVIAQDAVRVAAAHEQVSGSGSRAGGDVRRQRQQQGQAGGRQSEPARVSSHGYSRRGTGAGAPGARRWVLLLVQRQLSCCLPG